ncbi:MAG: hypothetical protein ACYTAS_13725 [Planctomycetota bacterium]|jgi:hypothetical protein
MKSVLSSKLLLPILFVCVYLGPAWAEHDHHDAPDVLGFDLTKGWLDPAVHSHFSRRGTPMIHSFRVEPAFTRRDLLLDYNFRNTAEGSEQEIEAELEWALSRRLGLVLEVPYVFLDPDDEGAVDGFGNFAISPRLLLAEYERFLLAFGLEIESPTGSRATGIAENEVALAPSLSVWADLGTWWAANAQSGVEYLCESDESELFVRASLIHTLAPSQASRDSHAEHEHGHGLHSGLLSLLVEIDTTIGLSGDEEGDTEVEGIVGAYYGLSETVDLRAGYQFPFSSSEELNSGLIAGLIHHF